MAFGSLSADQPMLEANSALSYMAAVTERIRLGAMVTSAVYRQPGLLIKAVTTLDVLSGGRAILGLGTGWYEREARGLGLHFPPLAERFERLEETLQIAHHLWSGAREPYAGRHYRLEEPVLSPPALSKPHPPILIGGGGERKTLRLVAQYADACNLFAYGGAGDVARKLEVLRVHCQAVGRPYEAIERTALGQVAAGRSSADLIANCRALAQVGVQHFIFSLAPSDDVAALERIGREVIPAVAELEQEAAP
jgi:F420-dependent oxidoreductase-like protein